MTAIKIGQREENTGKQIVVISFSERYLLTALFEGIDN
ncbi:Cysteine synthase [Liberibacter crescens BT-1]|uniref:Cysteine synthase n=1 Tax=Liberibacter crescens (strain BT-1) TaxID=1215343 RepID=L0ETA1_LIBCB|nr:Cysteine synthase [Liberibacter crescens BT-1]